MLDIITILHHLEHRFVPQRFRSGRLPSPSNGLSGVQPLAGQLVVFTGKLSSLGRKEARSLVARLGGVTADDVNARTTMLVIGGEGFGPATEDKSQKLKRAEELNAQAPPGQAIRILAEEDFCRLAGVPSPEAVAGLSLDLGTLVPWLAAKHVPPDRMPRCRRTELVRLTMTSLHSVLRSFLLAPKSKMVVAISLYQDH